MSRKERLEDLGKLSILLHNLYEDELFNYVMWWDRPKYAWDNFCKLDEEQKSECITQTAYSINRLQEKIAECCLIADGNENED